MTLNKWWHYIFLAIFVSCMSVAALIAIAAAIIYPSLPSLEALTDYHPKLPLQVFSEDGHLIGEFGEERRAYIKIENVPQAMKDAVLAIEDRRFYQHAGVDTTGVVRAIKNNITGKGREGASTITMQVAKNFFTPPNGKRTIITKINEALLAVKIERNLSKDKILELYLNQIYLGQRAYGFAAAAQAYYDKPLEKLNLAEIALLAGLPKAPSGYNPFTNPKRAIGRQHEVLRDMLRFGFLKEEAYQEALKQPLNFKSAKQERSSLSADYVAEIVRENLYAKYQDEIYTSGLKVYTTIRKANQLAANNAVREGVLDYDMRHGYRGPEKVLTLDATTISDDKTALDDALDEFEVYANLIPAIITKITPKSIFAHTKYGDDIEVTGNGLKLIEKTLKEKDPEKRLLKPGAVIRVIKTATKKNDGKNMGEEWRVVQLPEVESAFIAIDPETGAVSALVGGFDFSRNKFNHVTQAHRQPGSSLKPFIYSAALEKGYTAASIVDDAPLSFSAAETGDDAWSPQNYDNDFRGPVRLRKALTQSINTVAIRILEKIGPSYAQSYLTRFGFKAKDHPPYLTLALGAGSTTPWEMATAYAVFANGGYLVKPNIITKIVDSNGKVIMQSKYQRAGKDAPRVIDARNAFIMNSMLQSVVQNGTATKALSLKRTDIAGKTGTTNDHKDAWFTGYSPKQVGIAWIGFDKPRNMGRGETGGAAALPIWIKYMAVALNGVPEMAMRMPEGVVAINIDPATGTRSSSGILEYFYHENPPPTHEEPLPPLFGEEELTDDNAETDGEDANAQQNQAQKVLQPEVVLSPPNNAANQAKPENSNADPQNAAAKMLNTN